MRTLCISLLLFVTATFALRAEAAATTTNALCFFVVSETPITGGRYIDTAEFPKLGYISNAPSYVLTRLREVWTNDVTSISRINGKVVSTNTTPAVSIEMFPEDAKKFAEFTRQNLDHQVLLMLRDQPLMSPMIRAPIETGRLQLSWEMRAFPKQVVEGIQRLVRHE